MTAQDFDFICKLLKERTAIVLEPGKEYLVENRLAPLVHRHQFASISELVAQLRSEPFANGLQTQIIEALVNTETSFFRDHTPFESLRKVVLPDLIRRRQNQRCLNIWCAASSTGQEPYSLAMLLREAFPELLRWHISFVASDLSQEMLARAREGRYSQMEVDRGLPAAYLVKYFEPQGASWQLKEALRSMVQFKEINLAQSWPLLPPLDLVLLRNVMIYFEVETKKAILARIARLLRPDGYLLLGGVETTFNLDDSYKRVDLKSGFYQLVG